MTEEYECSEQNSIPKVDRESRSVAEIVRGIDSDIGVDQTS